MGVSEIINAPASAAPRHALLEANPGGAEETPPFHTPGAQLMGWGTSRKGGHSDGVLTHTALEMQEQLMER